MASRQSSLRLLAALPIALVATAGFAQSTVTLDATSGTGTISTTYTTGGGLTLNLGFFADYLVLAGGGGGGGSANDNTAWGGGGGGAGGLRTGTTQLLSGTSYSVQVGGGGAGGLMTSTQANQQGSNGANSIFGSVTAAGGGGGGRYKQQGNAGGSGGGGGGRASTAGGAGNTPSTTPSQGNSGGNARGGDDSGRSGGGGGGGAGGVGGNGAPTSSTAGNGGIGLASTITGASVTYAGGGGGGAIDTNPSAGETAGTGGTGGGGAGSTSGNATAGTDGLGGGGGGVGNNGAGGRGGAGLVVVRYQGASLGNIGGTVTSGSGSADGYTLHTFSTTGTTTASSALDLSGVNMNSRLGATLTGAISGTGGLTYAGPGTLTLAAANTYTGPTVIRGGTLAVGAGGSIAQSGTTLVVGGNLAGDSTANGLSGALVINGGNVSAQNVYIAHSTIDPRTSTGVLNVSSGTLSAAGNLGVGTRVENSSSYTLAGSGTLNVLSGGVVDVRGNLVSGSGSNFSVAAGGTLKVGGEWMLRSGSATAVNDGTIVFDGSSPQRYVASLAGSITGTGAFIKSGGVLHIWDGLLSTGGWTISSGTVQTAVRNIYNSSAVANDGVLKFVLLTSDTFAGAISGSGQLLLPASFAWGSLTLTGNNTFTGLTQLLTRSSGTLSVGNGGTSGSLAGGVLLSKNHALVFNRSDASTYGGNITGNGTLTKLGAGALTLTGSSTFTGQTTVSSGTLILGSGHALGPSSAVVVASGATLQATTPIRIGYIDSQGTVLGGENLSATLTVTNSGVIGGIANGSDAQGTFAAGIVKLSSGTSTVTTPNTYTGRTWVRAGTLVTGLANAFAGASDLTVDSGATLDRAGFSQTVDNADVDGAVGNSAAGGLLTVTGTLSGSGVLAGDVTVTGVHAPGNSPGIQTFEGNLSYGNGAVINWELTNNTQSNSPVVYDQIVLTGANNLAFSGANVLSLSFAGAGSLVDWTNSFWDVNRAWTVFDLATGVTTGFGSLSLGGSLLDANGLALDAGGRGSFSLAQSGQDVVLQFTAVPEPSTWALALAGLAGGYTLRRRKRAWIARRGNAKPLQRTLAVALITMAASVSTSARAAVTTYTSTFSGTIAAGDTALLTGTASVSGNVANSGTLQFNISGSSAVANNAIISGTGLVRMTGSGTVSSLFDAQTYTGATRLENGTLLINYNDRLGNTSSGVTFDGGRLQITNSGVNSTFSTARAMSLVSAGTIDTSTLADGSYDQPAFTGVVSGTGTLTLAAHGLGNGASDAYLRFGGASTYTGTTRITSGMVYASNTSAFGTSTVVLDGGGLVAPSAVTVNNAIVLAGTANFVRPWTSQTVNLGGAISGTGGLQKTDNGTVNLNAANTYTGDTRILAGTLNAANYAALAGTTLDMKSGDTGSIGFTVAQTGTYQIGGLTGSRNLANGGDTLAIGGNGTSTTYSGTLSGAGGLVKAGSGTLTLTGSNSYTGGTELQGGTLALGSAGAIGSSGTISFTGGALQYSAANTTDYSSRFSTAAGQNYSIDTNGQDVTLATRLQSVGGSLTKLGEGVLNLTATSAAVATVVLDLTTNVSAGSLNASGANYFLRIGNSGTGTLNVTGGSVGDDGGDLGYNAGSIGTATVSSGTWSSKFGARNVGVFGTGTLNVTGGHVTNGNGFVGNAAGSVGTVTVSSGTWYNHGILEVGRSGTGTLNVTGGSVLNTHGWLGNNAGSIGTATVSSGTWSNSSNLYVGFNGTGTLNVTGGSVRNAQGTVGDRSGSVGTVTVSSGTWNTQNFLYVGLAGTGALNVTGGHVTTTNGSILGLAAGSVGTATVSSGTWSNGGYLYVGERGTGTINVTGGHVTNSTGYLGVRAGSVGTVTVSSGTWANSGNLYVGVDNGGTATLTMSGGLVSVGGALARGTNGTINLNAGGTLQIGTGGITGVLATDLTNNGTLIFNRSNASTYSGTLSGSGAVTKQGAGTLTLSGNSTYTGPTVVTGGVLALQGAGDIAASSGVDLASGAALVVGSASGDRMLQMLTGSAGSFVDVGPRTLTVGNATSGTFAGGIFGSGGGLTKAGSGALTLSGSNSFTGQTTVSAGTLILGSGDALAPTAAVVVNSGATLQAEQPIRIGYLDSSGTVIGGGNLSATLTVTRSGNIGGIADGTDSQGTFAAGVAKLGAGTSTVNAANTYTGLTWVREGTLAMGLSNAFTVASDLTVDSGATFDRAGFSQTVTNAVVNGGVGNSSAGGLLTVTGTLSGSGSVNGATLVNGVHAPGNSPGIQTFNGDLTYAVGAAVEWELASNTTGDPGTNYDQIALPTGNLLFSGSTTLDLSFDGAGSTVAWSDPFWDSDRAWMVYDLGTGTTTGFASLLLGGSLLDSLGNALLETRGAFSTSLVGQDVFLSYTAVPIPEPSSYAMALAGLACAGYSLFRRRKRA